jgi:hypothetical protein
VVERRAQASVRTRSPPPPPRVARGPAGLSAGPSAGPSADPPGATDEKHLQTWREYDNLHRGRADDPTYFGYWLVGPIVLHQCSVKRAVNEQSATHGSLSPRHRSAGCRGTRSGRSRASSHRNSLCARRSP